jgi:hypothetical protein
MNEELTIWEIRLVGQQNGRYWVCAYSAEHACQVWACLAPVVWLHKGHSTTYTDTRQRPEEWRIREAIENVASGWRNWNEHHPGSLAGWSPNPPRLA